MGIKTKLAGLGAALALGLTLVGPVSAATNVGDVPISVTVNDGGTDYSLGVTNSQTVGDFGTVSLNADEDPNAGVKPVNSTTLTLTVSNDTKLYRSGANITFQLWNDATTQNGAYLPLTTLGTGGSTTFEGADQVNFQIPGRYLSISNVQNPVQYKSTGNGHWCTPAKWWMGSSNVVNGNNCTPKVAPGTPLTGNQPAPWINGPQTAIYKVGDVVGLFGIAYNPAGGACQVVDDNQDVSSCTHPVFDSHGNNSPVSVMYIRPGSGTVQTSENVTLSLGLPAGLMNGTYTGVILIDSSASS